MSNRAVCIVALTGVVLNGCALSPGACLRQQIRKEVFRITGTVQPGQTASQLVSYGVEGSQNDLSISWEGQKESGGPRLRILATRIECTPEKMTAGAGTGDCRYVASPAGINIDGQFVQHSLTIAHGRGNPDKLGPTNAYRLWVVGDRSRPASYTIASESFSGPDC